MQISDGHNPVNISINDAYNASRSPLGKATKNLEAAERAAFDGDITVQDSLRLQKAMFQMEQATALTSTMMKSIHEMTMGVIKNMG
jgi:hypothetical protein